jgi:regulator of RNase E activity RraB
MTGDPTYLEPLNKDAALLKQAEIDELLGQISVHELRLSKSYARLGSRLKEMKVNQYWMSLGYDKFTSYLEVIRGKIGRERSQMYAILSVAETLLPLLTEGQLEAVGISKAHELKRLVNEGGSVEAEILDPNNQTEDTCGTVRIMDYAADPKVTAKQLRVKVNELLHLTEDVQGTWHDLGGFYITPDEKKEVDLFWEVGRRLLAPKDEQQEHVWKKLVFLSGVRESLSTWLAEGADAQAA